MRMSTVIAVTAGSMVGAVVGAMIYPCVGPQMMRLAKKGKRMIIRKMHETCC